MDTMYKMEQEMVHSYGTQTWNFTLKTFAIVFTPKFPLKAIDNHNDALNSSKEAANQLVWN